MTSSGGPQAQRSMPQQNLKMTRGQIQMAKLFAKYDVIETSYHVHTGRIDLHLCDDSAPGKHIN